MLILGRKPGQYVVIGDIIVKVVREDTGLKLAIEAPKDTRIIRGEVYERENDRPAAVWEN